MFKTLSLVILILGMTGSFNLSAQPEEDGGEPVQGKPRPITMGVKGVKRQGVMQGGERDPEPDPAPLRRGKLKGGSVKQGTQDPEPDPDPGPSAAQRKMMKGKKLKHGGAGKAAGSRVMKPGETQKQQ